jgi:hypothetical protein
MGSTALVVSAFCDTFSSSLFTAITLLIASHCNHALLFDPGLAPHCMQLHFLPILYAHNTLVHNLHCNHSLHCFSMQSLSPTLFT